MHKLGSRRFFPSSVVYLAKPTFLRVTASHRHDTHSLYLMYVYLRMCIKYTCVCVRARARTPRHTAARAAT